MTTDAAERFAELADLYREDATVTSGRMFASEGLKTNGKVFAMLVRGELVVKLPAARCSALIEAGQGRRFDPGHGRLMKEWITLAPARARDWPTLAAEARVFVGGA